MSQKDYEELGLRLRAFRKSLHLSQRDFASRIDISNNYLSEIETGKANPSYDFFLKIISEYGISLDYLFKGKGDMICRSLDNMQLIPVSKEMIESVEALTLEQLYWLIEHSSGLKFRILGAASEYIYQYKNMLLDILDQEEKKAQEGKPV